MKCPLHLKYMLALLWKIWSDILSRQCSTYMNILMIHWIDTNTTTSYCLKNCQICSKSHHLNILSSKCLPPARTQVRRRWRHVTNSTFNKQHMIQIWSLVPSFHFVDIWDLGTRSRQTFRVFTWSFTWCGHTSVNLCSQWVSRTSVLEETHPSVSQTL